MLIDAGEGVILKLLNEKHAAQLLSLRNQNFNFLAEWLPWVPHMQTETDFVNYIYRSLQRYAEGLEIPLVIMVGTEVVGRIGINYIDTNRIGAIGYWIGENFSGKGIITKACDAVVKHGFTNVGLNRIEIKCGVENFRSQAIPERLGFTREGILRQAEFLNGRFIDLCLYSLLMDEWTTK